MKATALPGHTLAIRHAPDEPAKTAPATPPYRTIFDEHLGYVTHALRRLGVPPRDLEDQVHEVFVVVHRLLPGFEADRPLRPWLLGIVYRVASDYRRLARHRTEVFVEAEEQVDEEPLADARLEQREARAMLDRALDALDDPRREVVVLRDLQDVPMAEVAAMVGVPLATAYSRLRIGRSELAEALKRELRKESRR